jgi:hypothetical protein
MDDLLLPPKDEVFSLLLREGTVLVHIDARKPDLVLPSWLLGQTHVILELGHDMAIPIPDLSVDTERLKATLSFQRQPFECTVPWSAVFGMTLHDGRGLLFPEDVPRELRHRMRVLGDDDDDAGAGDDEVAEAAMAPLEDFDSDLDDEPAPAVAAGGSRRRHRPRGVERAVPPPDPRRGLSVLDGGVSSREPLAEERPRPTHLRLVK